MAAPTQRGTPITYPATQRTPTHTGGQKEQHKMPTQDTSATSPSPTPIIPTQQGRVEAERNSDPWWTSCARAAIIELAGTGRDFCADDVRELGVVEPDHPNRWGAAFNSARMEGLIRATGFVVSRRAERSGGVLRTWRGVPR